jgi:6,7-dimethyl-8-ribityllumazine synthase
MKNKPIHIAIVSSAYRPEITKGLINSCLETLKEKGLSEKQIKIFYAPGALEIPLIAKKLARKKKYDAIIAFGAVIKGKTYHFEQVASECIRGCMQVSYVHEIPVVFEVICAYKKKDAMKRAVKRGVEGALTALKMVELLKKL